LWIFLKYYKSINLQIWDKSVFSATQLINQSNISLKRSGGIFQPGTLNSEPFNLKQIMDRIESIEDLRACLSNSNAFRARHNRPFITVSYAQSLDGSIASKNRRPIQLSGPESAVLTHQIRAANDTILIGVGTLLADDPRLTVRLAEGSNPQPIVLDTHLRTPVSARLVRQADLSPWIINSQDNHNDQVEALKNAGATPLPCTTNRDGKIDLDALMAILDEKQVNSIMVEGGAKGIGPQP
jgi:3,4-dihydroxy 2-butanone 4-phosphate synthase/GTP cyclohydrolase II